MRRYVFTALLALAILSAAGQTAGAQKKCGEEWKEKMLSEKIAFLTTELEITPEEAQNFWPIYNQVNKEKDEAMEQVIRTYKALDKAINENRPEKEISSLLDAYLKAQEAQRETENSAAARYRKVLPVEKVAKLYVGEEKFRRQHIRRLHDRPEGQKPGQANR